MPPLREYKEVYAVYILGPIILLSMDFFLRVASTSTNSVSIWGNIYAISSFTIFVTGLVCCIVLSIRAATRLKQKAWICMMCLSIIMIIFAIGFNGALLLTYLFC